jgi:hypothetical protein
VDAARLGMGDEVRTALIAITNRYQGYINGFNDFDRKNGEFYVEQSAMTALALQEALVQDDDGTIRIAPAVPPEWDFDGRVSVRHGTKVVVQLRKGRAVTVGFEIGAAQMLRVRNPWPGEAVRIVDARAGVPVRAEVSGKGAFAVIGFKARAGRVYRMEPAGQVAGGFAPISGERAASAKVLGAARIGLGRAASTGGTPAR